MTPSQVRALLEEVGALRHGHFLLTSGRHADRFFLLARLFEHPEAGARVGEALAAAVRQADQLAPVTVVVGPAMGGVLLAYDVARALHARAMFAEKDDGRMVLRRGFHLEPDEPVLVVEDALTTGGSVLRTIAAVEAQGGRVEAVAAVVRRGGHPLPFSPPLITLLDDDADDWPAEACPLCRDGTTAVSPKA
jgi:orotate phosphoribosyltransferase